MSIRHFLTLYSDHSTFLGTRFRPRSFQVPRVRRRAAEALGLLGEKAGRERNESRGGTRVRRTAVGDGPHTGVGFDEVLHSALRSVVCYTMRSAQYTTDVSAQHQTSH